MIARRKPIKRGKPPKRSGRIKAKKRSASEFARIYGSKTRVEFVNSLPCVVCSTVGFTENAHVAGGGMGRKGDASKIVPLCFWCHRRQHKIGAGTFAIRYNIDLKACAAATERAWCEFNGSCA